MNRAYTLLLATLAAILISACSDSSNFDPYAAQEKRPFYPSTITFNTIDNNETKNDKKWDFTYNSDNTIKTYKYQNTITTKDGKEITEAHTGKIIYYTDATGNRWMQNDIIVSNTVKDLTTMESYIDTIKEDVRLSSGLIQSIRTTGQRSYSNGTKEIYSNSREFTYTDKYCTSSIHNTSTATTTYRYAWSNSRLNKITVSEQGKNNNIQQQVYSYTYSNRDLGCDYGFNTLAFIYGNMPEIYAAMNLFGETSAYKLESEYYSGYGNINGMQYNISPISRSFSILETTGSITYMADSPNSSTYNFTFTNK